MKSSIKLILSLCFLIFISCGECEDKTLDISDTLMAYLPYEQITIINMANEENDTLSFTIVPDLDISEEKDGDCISTSIKPFFTVNTATQDEFMRIWASLNEDFILGDHEQLWFIIDDTDGSILESGMVRNPLLTESTISLNGSAFDNVISVVLTADQGPPVAIYLQRNVGFIAYQLMNETWVIQ